MFERDLGDGWRVEPSHDGKGLLLRYGEQDVLCGWTEDGVFETTDNVTRIPFAVLETLFLLHREMVASNA